MVNVAWCLQTNAMGDRVRFDLERVVGSEITWIYRSITSKWNQWGKGEWKASVERENQWMNKTEVVQRCPLLYIRHHSGQNVVASRGAAGWVHNKFWPLWWWISLPIRVQTTLNHFRFVFLPQHSTPKKLFISERDQNHNTTKEQALSITFSQYDWFISQNERSWLAITLRDKLTRAWREQRCLDSYRQRQISQSDCEITSNYSKKLILVINVPG